MSRVLMVSHDVVGISMAGPGIRAWELARVLGQEMDVTLAVPGEAALMAPGVQLWPFHPERWETLAPAAERADVVVAYADVLAWFPALLETGTPLVVDGSDPHTLETLAWFDGMPQQEQRHAEREWLLQLECRAGDFFICASERQRDWWLGLLEASGRINVHTYMEDPALRSLIDVVPYGFPSEHPCHTRQVLKGVWPGIGADDRVVLWGGGLWQWLDPLTAIRAVARLRERRPDVHLVFPGTRHPNPGLAPMPMLEAARGLAAELGLLGNGVLFGEWVPYADWPNVLLEADVGLSLHRDTIEARLAFRTRVLSYVGAGLPVVLTRGDATADLVKDYDLGVLVEYEDVDGVAEAILRLLDEPPGARAEGFAAARHDWTWERAARPLADFCRAPRRAADRRGEAGTDGQGAAIARGSGGCEPRDDLLHRLAVAQAEAARLQALVAGYERGRFIRLMRWLNARHRGRRA